MQTKSILMPLALASGIAAQITFPPPFNNNGSLIPLGTILATQPQLTNFIALLATQPNLLAQLTLAQNVTLLAPNNDAVNAFLTGPNATPLNQTTAEGVTSLLAYHMLNGTIYDSDITSTSRVIGTQLTGESFANITGGQRVMAVRNEDGNATFYSGMNEASQIVTSNLNFTGGTIHIVNRMLTVPVNDTQALTNQNLTSALSVIRRAGLDSRLASMRDVTIFAPTNEAFERAGNALESNMTTEQLTSILNYHVVQGQVPIYNTGLANTTMATVNGGDLTFTNASGVLYVNSARVVSSNILTSNGVVHVIDNVLNPANTGFTDPSSGSAPTPESTSTAGNGNAPGGTAARGAAAPMKTGAVGAAALFGGAALLFNL